MEHALPRPTTCRLSAVVERRGQTVAAAPDPCANKTTPVAPTGTLNLPSSVRPDGICSVLLRAVAVWPVCPNSAADFKDAFLQEHSLFRRGVDSWRKTTWGNYSYIFYSLRANMRTATIINRIKSRFRTNSLHNLNATSLAAV